MAKQTQTDKGLQKAQGICNPMSKRLFTLKEAAVYLGRSVWGMRDIVWKRLLPVVMVPGTRKIFLDVKDLDKFIDNNKQGYS